jgi:ubiquitin C-terminal hydrolase
MLYLTNYYFLLFKNDDDIICKMLAGTLENLGNTCCINTFIQCIAHTPKLNKFFLSNINNDSSIANELKSVLNIIWENKNNRCLPKGLLHSIFTSFPDIIVRFQQHDLCELITLIFDKISCDIGTNIDKTIEANDKIQNTINIYNNNKTSKLITNIQNCQLNIINCKNCNYQQINTEVFNTLMVDIGDNNNFNNIIVKYFEKEDINEWRCDKCNNINCAEKFVKLWSLPNVLIIVLKRFNGNLDKISTHIDIPQNITFNKGSILNNIHENCSYNLMAIGCHVGSYNGGHYYAICKNNENWYIYDDNNCTKLDEFTSSNAYILFYQKI